MKRLLSLLLVLVLVTTVVVGCTKPADDNKGETNTPVEKPEDNNDKNDDTAEAGEIVKLGLGQNMSIASSKDAEDDKNATGQANVTMAAVGFDKDGKVVSVTIDTVQPKVEVDKDGKIASDINEEVKTKKVLKDEYGMKDVSAKIGIGKEWYEQMEAFEEWMIGKTADEIKNLKVKERDESHKNVPDVEELTSSVTITVESYIAAVVEAWENAVEVENATKVGLGSMTTVAKSKDAADDEPATVQADTTMSATAFDKDGKVAGTIVDVAQIKIEIKDGKIASDVAAELKTKHELKDEYGMKDVSAKIGIGKEWYEQMNAFQDWMKGKTVDEITGLKVKERDESHKSVPDVEELTSSVTITVESYQEVVKRASELAK
ncbi:hypothetical protein [Wansuia hejianensis]|uniref:Uncharacterized protein n=1 Tax=Wansuia hejianensis TaxID=2763667 RepID=A0A926F3G3_9FIRM|nr:hypothetical protein [Wansuia hejianensis]MBC8591204.1 hypothetical protein [Wansuia hejianensis]